MAAPGAAPGGGRNIFSGVAPSGSSLLRVSRPPLRAGPCLPCEQDKEIAYNFFGTDARAIPRVIRVGSGTESALVSIPVVVSIPAETKK